MTLVLEATAAGRAPASPAADAQEDAAQTIEDLIAAHRAALVALAPSQAERAVRRETAWHMEELGLLLRVRDTQTQNAADGTGSHRRHEENTGTDRRTR